jgi:hypothetical protein
VAGPWSALEIRRFEAFRLTSRCTITEPAGDEPGSDLSEIPGDPTITENVPCGVDLISSQVGEGAHEDRIQGSAYADLWLSLSQPLTTKATVEVEGIPGTWQVVRHIPGTDEPLKQVKVIMVI